MRAGRHRWPITIQQKTETQSSTGSMVPSWSTFVAPAWADISPIARAGSKAAWEIVLAQQTVAKRVAQFDIRYIPGLTETMRVVDYDGLIWDIKSIIDLNMRHRELWLICEFGADAG